MRPPADPVAPGQESVWSYPRPAIAQPVDAHIMIEHHGQIVAETRAAVHTIETSHPPTYYIPPAHVAAGMLRRAHGSSFCEWKGAAIYWDVIVGAVVLARAGWSYPSPTPAFAMLRDHVAFYAGPFDRCTVDGEVAAAQAGHFYGGWITGRVAGPFKGGAGTHNW